MQPSLNKGFELSREHAKYDGWLKLSSAEYEQMAHIVERLAYFGIHDISLASHYDIINGRETWRFDWLLPGALMPYKLLPYGEYHKIMSGPSAWGIIQALEKMVAGFAAETVNMGRA